MKGNSVTFDKMIPSLVEVLEEKGILTYEEWEARIRKKIEGAKGLTKFDELED